MKIKHATASTLKQFRNEAGMSQEQLARKSGIDRTYISGVERSVRNITLDSLEGIIEALGVTSAEFMRRLHLELLNTQ
ncbi:helix-turn-helix transcriptional regulator [Shewanella eurypsychrophilus]|uniref:Helix-turn-helix transcriptional regulator n=1 Tax=Shewanella eurypsychrophilus TaxID=2593656 RepID=A0ABX6V3K9_9GAMM|nr:MULTISPECIES: helix-turn-helix transcriptional regulator [Shewanella]QFU21271.1 helix-turn-helix domain-containing protein [Shewanella sp. YLB-09]QPG56562.1 helix-turn-helix transcriptional regulator [Shewanella eurypsychrophilus]